jgi:kexin
VGITTTALRGGYRDDFSGTSAAAPMVSGVATLLLARHPDLSWRDVRLILAQSARETDPGSGSWLPSALPAAAGGGNKRFSHLYGFGVVDATAALQLAANWRRIGGSSSLVACPPFNGRGNLPIADASASGNGAPTNDTIAVAAASCGITSIEFVEVAFATDHTYPADLRIRLYSPASDSGAARWSELAQSRRPCGDPSGRNPCESPYRQADGSPWRFGTVRHMGEPAAGTWRLEVIDQEPQDSGRVLSWSLQIWGR